MSNTAQCPVCGKTITKEQFLKQKICPNPMCGSELDDEEEIYEAFGIPMDNEAEASKEDVDLLEQLIQGSRYQKVDRQRKAQDVSSFLNGSSATVQNAPKQNEPSEKAAEKRIQKQNDIQANNSAVNESSINKNPEEEFVKTESHPDTSSENTKANADVLAEKDKTIAMLLEKIESMNKEQNSNGSQGSSNSEVNSDNTIADDKTVDEQQVYNNNDVDYHEVNQSVNEMLKENPFKLKDDTIENDEQPTVDTSSVLDNTLEATSQEELADPHDVKADSEEKNEVVEEKELSSADKLRMRLKGNRISQSNEDIDKAVEEKYVAEHRENVSEDYNSNYDGYYDDTESEVPPEPDVINIGTIRRAVIAVVVIVVFSAFLIYYV